MTLFQKLQDAYFDAIRLREALERIPPQCECMDADAHLEGKCCCATVHQGGHLSSESEQAPSMGCTASISKLRDGIQLFQDDLRKEQGQLLADEAAETGRPVILIESMVNSLTFALDRIEMALTQFRETCAHDALIRLKESSKELERYIEELNGKL
jgi:hypothetical protein